jgi:hypothetical protein
MDTLALKIAILVLALAACVQAVRIFTREGFNVVGGTIDTRLASLGSTSKTGAANQWIQVATFSNTAASQGHAMTLAVSPRDMTMGNSAHTIYLMASNTSTGPNPPVFLMKTDVLSQGGTASIISARVRQTQDPSNALSNTYDLFLQLGPDQAFGIPGVWTLTGFTPNDTVAVAEVSPMSALPTTGTAWFNPVITSAYQFNPNQVGNRFYGGSQLTYTSVGTAGNVTYTPAQVIGGYMVRSAGANGVYTDTLPSAASLFAACNNTVGATFEFVLYPSWSINLAAGSGGVIYAGLLGNSGGGFQSYSGYSQCQGSSSCLIPNNTVYVLFFVITSPTSYIVFIK